MTIELKDHSGPNHELILLVVDAVGEGSPKVLQVKCADRNARIEADIERAPDGDASAQSLELIPGVQSPVRFNGKVE